MPSMLERVAAVIGEPAALILAERLGGSPLYIPQHPARGSPLVLAIGHGPAARLCDAFPSQSVQLPSRSALDAGRRREAVRYDLRRGLPAAEIARRHGLTVRHVRRLRAEEASA